MLLAALIYAAQQPVTRQPGERSLRIYTEAKSLRIHKNLRTASDTRLMHNSNLENENAGLAAKLTTQSGIVGVAEPAQGCSGIDLYYMNIQARKPSTDETCKIRTRP